MMAAKREASRARLQDKLEKTSLTRKDKLYNDVVDLLQIYRLSWKSKDIANSNGA